MKKSWTITSRLSDSDHLVSVAVRFVWQVDRFAHLIVWQIGGNERVLLESREGNDQQDFPISPPIQDMSVEQRPASQVALGVGMAGTGLWSLSAEAPHDQGWIEFDWACQPRGSLLWPKNCYRMSVGNSPAKVTGGRAVLDRWESPSGRTIQVVLDLLGVGAENSPHENYALDCSEPNTAHQNSVLTLEQAPSDSSGDDSGRDVGVTNNSGLRWRYRVQILE